MPKHVYLRAYMAGVVLPCIFLMFVFAVFCVVRFGLQFPLSIERALVFPLALIPNLWGLWNMLYVRVHRHSTVSPGLFGAIIPLFAGPVGLWVAHSGVGFEFPPVIAIAFPVALALAVVAYYLVWKYLVSFLNHTLEIA